MGYKSVWQEKMLRADLNRDEQTTHLHCFVLMTDEQGRFNSSRFFNKKSSSLSCKIVMLMQ